MKFFILFLVLLVPFVLFSQDINYTGKVFSIENGKQEVLIGATVRTPDRSVVVSTDINGDFVISLPDSIPAIVHVNYGGEFEPAFLLLTDQNNELNYALEHPRKMKRRNRKIIKAMKRRNRKAAAF